MHLKHALFALAFVTASTCGAASGEYIISYSLGTGFVGGLTEGGPGAAVVLDYTVAPDVAPPAQVVGVLLAFGTVGITFQDLAVQLDAGGPEYSYPSLNGTQVAHMIYDPAHLDPAGIQSPHSEMDQLWRDELADGVLNCRVWVDGVTLGTPTEFSLGASVSFLVPEPASGMVLGLGALFLARRRR